MNNEPVAWTACLDCGQRVTGDSIHTCSQQLKTLKDEEIKDALYVADITLDNLSDGDISMERIKAFIRIVLRKASEK